MLNSLGTYLLQRVNVNGFKDVLSFLVGMEGGEEREGKVPAHRCGIPASRLSPEPDMRRGGVDREGSPIPGL